METTQLGLSRRPRRYLGTVFAFGGEAVIRHLLPNEPAGAAPTTTLLDTALAGRWSSLERSVRPVNSSAPDELTGFLLSLLVDGVAPPRSIKTYS